MSGLILQHANPAIFGAGRRSFPDLVERTVYTVPTLIGTNGAGKPTTLMFIVRLALQFAHRAYVLDTGEIRLAGPCSELMDHPEIKKAYLGG